MKLAIGLGTSLGPRRARLELALRWLAHAPGLRLRATSAWVVTPPMRGGTARGAFLNGVALVDCDAPLLDVLSHCASLEDRAGRRRGRYWGDRTLDLDLLLADGVVLHTPRLQLPHPGLLTRRFVLGPLLEVWPDAVDPRTGQPVHAAPAPGGPRPVPVGQPRVARPRRDG